MEKTTVSLGLGASPNVQTRRFLKLPTTGGVGVERFTNACLLYLRLLIVFICQLIFFPTFFVVIVTSGIPFSGKIKPVAGACNSKIKNDGNK